MWIRDSTGKSSVVVTEDVDLASSYGHGVGETPPERQLPRTHLLALRLAALGAGDELIAECLGVEPEAVGPLLEVAQAKAQRAGLGERSTRPAGSPTGGAEPPGGPGA